MEIIERIPLREIHYLNEMKFSQFKAYCKASCKNDDERKIQYDIMRSFCQTNIKTRGETKRVYSFTESTPLEVGGRLYCGNSLQGLSKHIRGLLLRNTATDLDMKNAHPVILNYLCKINNIRCPELEYYVNHRDEILSSCTDKEKVKEMYLKAVNDDKLNKKATDKNFKKFDVECKSIQQSITALPIYKHIVDSVPSSRNHNWLGSAINRILCVYENKILGEVISILNKKQIEICSLAFDGLMIYGSHYDNVDLIRDIEQHVESKFEGLGMKFAFKQHSDLIKMPDDYEIPVKKEDEVTGVWNDVEAADLVFEKYPHWVNCNENLYVFDQETGLWSDTPSAYNKIIISLSEHLHILAKDGCEIVRTPKSYGNTLSLMQRLPPLIRSKCVNDRWLDEMQYTSLGKILFNNGYYDFKTGQFFDKENAGFSPKIMFVGKINHDYDPSDEEEVEYIKSIKQRFFYDPLGTEQGDYLSLQIARGLAGDKMKRIMFGLGSSNCGKSIISTAIMQSCGDYAGSFNAENLAYRNSSNDEAQIMRWAMLLRFKRIIISNEMKSTTDLNGNMIKKISSGGDKIVGRGHQGNETEFITHFLPICMANDLPNIKPYDDAVNNRLRVVSYNKSFVDEPTNEFELKKDNNIEEEIRTKRFQKCFVNLLIEEYANFVKGGCVDFEPAEVLKSKSAWVKQEKSIVETFKDDFEITDNKDDFVRSSDIQTWLESKKLGVTITKFGVEMNKYSVLNKHENIESKNKKIAGKVVKIWTGIRMTSEVEEETY